MSDTQSALPGAQHSGLAEVAEAGLKGMITLRGDLGSAALAAAVKDLVGTDMPGQRETRLNGERGAVWMSPDELLLLVPHGAAEAGVEALSRALGGEHHLATNVSDARVVFTVTGEGAREVLGKLTPADLHPDAFGPGQVRRTRLAQVPAAFWMRDARSFDVVAFRSVAAYVFDILKGAANPKAPVDFY
jgi:sarcosine oxidase subunit gamma